MTCKPTLKRWATGLGANLPASATVQDLEQAIETAIAPPATTGISLGQGLRNNWAVVKTEAIPVVKAIAANFRS